MPINHIIYADDMVVLAPSAHALQLFLNKCDSDASGHEIVYNMNQRVGMCVKPKQLKSNIVHEFVAPGNNLKHEGNHKYIRVQLLAN